MIRAPHPDKQVATSRTKKSNQPSKKKPRCNPQNPSQFSIETSNPQPAMIT